MSNAILNRICNDENDPMLGVKICCKHGDLLSMQTSRSKDNPGRRFWFCPHYRFCTPVPTFLLVLNITYESNVATYETFVATDASNVATYHPYVATFDHLRHMLLQMTYILLHMRHM
ncbi:hypothetical protein H5410_021701 [Solanum commersonii]|uniref:Uncharacterized protein n=1 Tax=Solanum commersonii TaxID=4109 RepID=A0A9J5ZG15_SOLCO|nr:hypothetical protein H5410_021701 [Solanum commersonii]